MRREASMQLISLSFGGCLEARLIRTHTSEQVAYEKDLCITHSDLLTCDLPHVVLSRHLQIEIPLEKMLLSYMMYLQPPSLHQLLESVNDWKLP